MTTVLAGLRCIRCGGTSVRPVDPETGLRDDLVHACPHCSDDANVDVMSYTVADRYNVQGFRATTDDVDQSDALDTYTVDLGALSDLQYRDFVAVRGEGQSYPERAADRGVDRSTVRTNVLRAAAKLQEADE